MTVEQIRGMVDTEAYGFLRTNPHLGERIMLLTVGGSHAYGTNVESSDVDLRGCTRERANEIIGWHTFEQVVDKATDTTIYAFNKLVQLLVNCNPNSIEMLGCKPEHYLVLTQTGKELIEKQKMFLSKRAVHTFAGYAAAQLRRLENAICRDALDERRKNVHILKSMESTLYSFQSRYEHFQHGGIQLFVEKKDLLSNGNENTEEREGTTEIYADIHLNRFPVGEFNGMLNELKEVLSSYQKLNGRNRKKDAEHLDKHAMHLVRLYLMAFDILENERVVTYRENERPLLMEIRNGKYRKADGTYQEEFFEMINEFDKRLMYDKENTALPEEPNMNAVEEFVMEINRESLKEDG